MRGHDEPTHHMFSYLSPEQRVPADHPRPSIREKELTPCLVVRLSPADDAP